MSRVIFISLSQIENTFVKNNISGERLKVMSDLEWGQLVTSELWPPIEPLVKNFYPNLPLTRLNPKLSTLNDIHAKLKEAGQGVVWFACFSQCFKRVPLHDLYYGENESWCQNRGGRPYFSPSGWRRYGFYPHVEESPEEYQSILDNWHIAYHGTNERSVDSIVQQGLVPPGAKLPNGTVITSLHGRAGAQGKNVVYLSPSIEYASHYLYTHADKSKAFDENTNEPIYVHPVLQVRVKPGCFRVQGNTLWAAGWPDRSVLYDRKFFPDELEWIISGEMTDCIRVTGLMVRRSKVNPKDEVMAKYQQNLKLKNTPRAVGKGEWQFNAAPTGGSVLSSVGPWTSYLPEMNARIEKAFMGWLDMVFLGALLTGIGQKTYYIDFLLMRQIRTDDNKLFRAVRRVVVE
eukprot:TRINITY_DN2761_c0_g1_i1.p1 TRINITY_DN2761_c0_g1~~TRINITY_DN2761_c0_g1_i1.p1  ORF type:complete len:403 (+),score=53.50 TRINITY_DN2761_c0_g1_i1:240-1448(+)